MFFFFSSITSSAELLFSSSRRKELAVILLSRTPWPKPRLSSWLSLRSIITSSWPVESTPMSFISMSHILHQNIHWCLQWTCINHVCQSQWDHWVVFEHQTNKAIFIKQPDKTTLDRLNYGQKHFTFNCGVFSPPTHLRLDTCQCFIYLIGQIYSSKDPRMTVLMVMMCLNGRLSNHLLFVIVAALCCHL